jgi:hypothetical protein
MARCLSLRMPHRLEPKWDTWDVRHPLETVPWFKTRNVHWLVRAGGVIYIFLTPFLSSANRLFGLPLYTVLARMVVLLEQPRIGSNAEEKRTTHYLSSYLY